MVPVFIYPVRFSFTAQLEMVADSALSTTVKPDQRLDVAVDSITGCPRMRLGHSVIMLVAARFE